MAYLFSLLLLKNYLHKYHAICRILYSETMHQLSSFEVNLSFVVY